MFKKALIALGLLGVSGLAWLSLGIITTVKATIASRERWWSRRCLVFMVDMVTAGTVVTTVDIAVDERSV
jgi:hypothetical protein